MNPRCRTLHRVVAASVAISLLAISAAAAFTRIPEPFTDGKPHTTHATDCTLEPFDLCSCEMYVYQDDEHAIWGAVFQPGECEGGCPTGGAVREVLLYSRCEAAPARIDGIRIQSVDATACPTALLYESGPIEIEHCLPGDRWTSIRIPLVPTSGQPFVVQIEWGPAGLIQLASDNTGANAECGANPHAGCSLGCRCDGWHLPVERSFIYVTDVNGDGVLDDLCQAEGAPMPLAFPYVYPYGYLPNNLLVSVILDCTTPTATAPGTWGRVKELFE